MEHGSSKCPFSQTHTPCPGARIPPNVQPCAQNALPTGITRSSPITIPSAPTSSTYQKQKPSLPIANPIPQQSFYKHPCSLCAGSGVRSAGFFPYEEATVAQTAVINAGMLGCWDACYATLLTTSLYHGPRRRMMELFLL